MVFGTAFGFSKLRLQRRQIQRRLYKIQRVRDKRYKRYLEKYDKMIKKYEKDLREKDTKIKGLYR